MSSEPNTPQASEAAGAHRLAPVPRVDGSAAVDVAVQPIAQVDSSIGNAVLAALDEGVVVVDREGGLIQTNAAASTILGVDLASSSAGAPWWEALGATRAGDTGTLDIGRHVLEDGVEVRAVALEVDRRGERITLSANYLPLRGTNGTIDGLVLSFRDITDDNRDRRHLVESQERLREAHDVARLASWEWRPLTGEVIVFQALAESELPAGARMTFDEWLAMVPGADHDRIQDDFTAFVHGQQDESVRRFEHTLATGAITLEIRSRAVRDAAGRLLCVRGTAQDVSEQERARGQLTATSDFLQATLDSLGTQVAVLDETGEVVMTNRAWGEFGSENGAAEGSAGVGANYLDVCDAAVDPVAASVAAGLRTVARGAKLTFETEYQCDGPGIERWFRLRATRYEGAGPRRIVVAHEDVSEQKAAERLAAVDSEKLAWVARIEDALANERFVLEAQPILELATGRVVQRELLIRMRQPEGSVAHGLIPPASFLPVAEEYGLITKIDRWVIDRAAVLAATGLPVELNVSGRSISDPRLVDYIESAIERTGAEPQTMVFEITETTLVNDDVSARAFVARLHALGCRVALDDFGTGYGGFTYLKQLPIDFLKIDIEFVSDLAYNAASHTVVQAIVRLAQGFGLKTVAEGVEDEETMDALRGLGVDYAQGYHIGRPLSLASGAAQTGALH